MSKKKKASPFFVPRISTAFIGKMLLLVIVGTLVVIDTIQRVNRSSVVPLDPLRVQGEMTAPLHVIQYVDFKSPECARGYFFIQEYMAKYPHKILLQTKHFPFTEQNAGSLTAAVYVHCSAEQNKFAVLQNLIWERQSQWDKFYDVAPLLDALAKEAKLNPDKLAQCVHNEQSINYVLTEKDYAEALFVKGTPTYFLNNEMVVGVQELQAKMEKYLRD